MIRTGAEFRASIHDDRVIFINGKIVKDGADLSDNIMAGITSRDDDRTNVQWFAKPAK